MSTRLHRLIVLLTALLLISQSARPDEIKPFFLKPDAARDEKLLRAMKVLSSELFRDGAAPKLDIDSLFRFRSSVVSGRHYDDPARDVAVADFEQVLRDAVWDMDMDALRGVAFATYSTAGREMRPVFFIRSIQDEVAKVVSDPNLKPAFAADAEPLRPFYRSAEMHRERASTLPFAKLSESVSKLGYRSLSGNDYADRVLDVVMNRNKSVAGELMRFAWLADCGFGAGEFYDEQSTVVFMALLRERRIAEAVGAGFRVPSVPKWLQKKGTLSEKWRIDFLKFCGLDWEGELLASELVEVLVVNGSERAAKAYLADARTTGRAAPSALELASRFVSPRDGSGPVEVEISPATQGAILNAISEQMGEELPFWRLTEVVQMARRLGRAELKPALQRLLTHPSTTIRKLGAAVLREYGEQIEPIADAPPVLFQVTLNGQPFASKSLKFEMEKGDGRESFGLSDCTTDTGGLAKIRRDIFLDPASRGPNIRFVQKPKYDNRYDESTQDSTWTETTVSSPKSFDGVTDVRLTAFNLSFEIGHPEASENEPRIGRFTLRRAGDKDMIGGFCYTRIPVPPGAKTTFNLPAIGAGQYELFCDISGCERRIHSPFEAGPQMTAIRITLRRGVDIDASVFAPKNQRGSGGVHLYREGIDVSEQFGPIRGLDTRPFLFSGLPEGSYQLRFNSTKEYVDANRITSWAPIARGWPDLRDAVDCEGRIVKFVVERKSKSPLDLGRIELDPTPEMKRKAGPLTPILTNSAGTQYFSKRPDPNGSGL